MVTMHKDKKLLNIDFNTWHYLDLENSWFHPKNLEVIWTQTNASRCPQMSEKPSPLLDLPIIYFLNVQWLVPILQEVFVKLQYLNNNSHSYNLVHNSSAINNIISHIYTCVSVFILLVRQFCTSTLHMYMRKYVSWYFNGHFIRSF